MDFSLASCHGNEKYSYLKTAGTQMERKSNQRTEVKKEKERGLSQVVNGCSLGVIYFCTDWDLRRFIKIRDKRFCCNENDITIIKQCISSISI